MNLECKFYVKYFSIYTNTVFFVYTYDFTEVFNIYSTIFNYIHFYIHNTKERNKIYFFIISPMV